MASSQLYFTPLFLLFLVSRCVFETPPQPNALILPIEKQASSLQYVTRIGQRTPLVPIDVVLDLGGPFLWVSCDHPSYSSSSYRSTPCHSAQCSLVHAGKTCKHCSNGLTSVCSASNTCILFFENSFTSKVSTGDLSKDVLSLKATDGLNPTFMVTASEFLFLCAPGYLLEGLASGAKGIAGFGHGQIGLPTQLATAFNFSRKFAICLPPSTNTTGVIFLGDGPYVLLPGIDISKLLIYTPMTVAEPRRKTSRTLSSEPLNSHEYHIKVQSLRVNGERIPLNSSLLRETMVSTTNPYTTLQTSIYNSLTTMFIRKTMAANVTRVAPIAPFDLCFSTKSTSNGGLFRPAMPVIDLMLNGDIVFWRIFETNSMVPMGGDVACLGFLDGGIKPRTSIVLGGYQLEDNFLQFDLESSRLGFTSSLLLRETSCANFNFTLNV